MLVITGACGFIGSCLVNYLNELGLRRLVLVDDFKRKEKRLNLQGKAFLHLIDRVEFIEKWFPQNAEDIEYVFHLGARTDTTEQDTSIFDRLNLNYSKRIWAICAQHQIPLVYASSAATYGSGECGYLDNHDLPFQVKPLNPYGLSKNDFDKWALIQAEQPPSWVGLKFFNVYGPNEYHKGRMASVIFHTFKQIQETGKMRLFRSHRPEFANGEQQRDFVYVKDVIAVCAFLFKNKGVPNGLYNLGTGTARTFLDLARNTFYALDLEPKIEFIDTPIDIRATYQYFTEADMSKLIGIGYRKPFYSLEEGVKEYVSHYLKEHLYY